MMRTEDLDEQDGAFLRRERELPETQVMLPPGHLLIPEGATAIGAVLASSVVVTLFDLGAMRGAMCHFAKPRAATRQQSTAFFGLLACRKLVQEMRARMANGSSLVAGVYGGATPEWASIEQCELARENVEVGYPLHSSSARWYLTGMEEAQLPVGGVDYPRTFEEFDAWFDEEGACRAYVIRLRWPDGFACPHCGVFADAWTTGRGLLHCRSCQGQTSTTAGTVFEGTRKPLRLWFLAMWFVTSQKHGASALGLQRVLGLGSYQTAWAWLHKLRRAMVRPGRERLLGRVEVDEAYVGAPEAGVHGRETESKALVAIAVEENGKGIGRIRMARIDDASASSLEPFLKSSVAPGAVVHTDGWPGYAGVKKLGYVHEVTNVKRSGRPAHETMPRVHRIASLLKRWLLGTHHGAVSHQHLDYYLDEYTFRFNRRTSRARGLLFHRLVQQAVATGPSPYRSLVCARSLLELE